MDNLSPQIHGENHEQSFTYNLIKDEVEFIKGDVTNSYENWKKAIDGVDVIVHLAQRQVLDNPCMKLINMLRLILVVLPNFLR